MNKKFCKVVAMFVVTATLATGCRSTEEYKKIAEAGNKYAEAVDQLLIAAGDIRIEASSEKFLRNDRVTNLNVADYNKVSQVDDRRIEILGKIRKHNHLLQAYFAKLFELADSQAPQQASTEIEGITSNLNKIGKELQGSDLITDPSVFAGVTNVIVGSQLRGALREELEKRNKTIVLELTIQKELLQALSQSIEQDMALIKIAQEERLVIRPLIQEELISDNKEWIEFRKDVLTMQRRSNELKEASEALEEFKNVFQNFIEGKLTIQRVNGFLREIDSFLAIVEASKTTSN
ncbi:hypothetical protein FD723_13410 [Nostoc sp. C052]|uniref:hypothetical protein n=1 Tax=Nostoc sp. C052 TaxID=2576902 RepID=UPI0015C40266|nr:hypothetical protein [Nostoc sp. C052]QLE41337.1 hypothetical protein FD723_13410 [Nostoc sp. C052]